MQQLKEILEKQRRFFETGKTKDLDFRIAQLKILREAIIARESLIMEALKKDLNKDAFDSYTSEIGLVLNELTEFKNNGINIFFIIYYSPSRKIWSFDKLK